MKLLQATKRTRLERMTSRHLSLLSTLFNDAQTLKFLQVKKINAFFLSYKSEMKLKQGEAGLYCVFDKKSDNFLGRAGVRNNGTRQNVDWELHILLHGKAQKKGYGTEIILATMKDAFENRGAHTISFVIAEQNAPMQKLARRLGFFSKKTHQDDGYLHYEVNRQNFDLLHSPRAFIANDFRHQ